MTGPLASFELGDFSEVAAHSVENGSLSISADRGYASSRSAKASYNGGSSGFQRVWQNVDWKAGSDIWYGLAVYVPNTADYCYWNPIRWDNYKTYGGGGDIGGLSIERGQVYVIQNFYGGSERQLVSGGALPQGRWVWLEVHQKLSAQAGHALTELYVDDTKVGSSTQPNSAGRVVNHLRAGVVNVAGSCSRASSVYFDRFSVSDGRRGPVS